MKVWVVTSSDPYGENEFTEGVFSTREKAEAFVVKESRVHRRLRYVVEVFEVDHP